MDTNNETAMAGPAAQTAEGDSGLTAPLPGFEENPPAYSGLASANDSADAEPVIPLSYPGDGGFASQTNTNSGSSRSGNITFPWFPTFPACPGCNSNPAQPYGQVRFLNASTNGITVNISIDRTIYAPNSRFATLSNYDWISDGFHTVSVQRANGLRSILLQQTFPFVAGQNVTMVLTDSAEGGLEMIRVIDSGCRNLPFNSGCFRFANMTYSGSSLDLLLSGQTIFRNIRYQSVSSYKQAVAGNYQFSAATSTSYSFIRELPIIVLGAVGASISNRRILLSFNANIRAGKNYTAYLIGNTWSNANLQAVITED